MAFKRYRMTLSYDGTDYFGWQVQKEYRSVAGVLQRTFKKIFDRDVSILGASRTDAGVHALGQVATFSTDLPMAPERIKQAWNNLLPPTIIIRDLSIAPDNFHPHKNVLYKEYWYHIFPERPLPFYQRYGWFYRYPIDIEKLKECLNLYLGTHDFRSFYTSEGVERDTVRTIDAIAVTYLPEYNAYRIAIRGQRFLRYMIRRMVGGAVDVASRKELPVAYLKEVLGAADPRHTLPNAPAQGLLLQTIVYNEGIVHEAV